MDHPGVHGANRGRGCPRNQQGSFMMRLCPTIRLKRTAQLHRHRITPQPNASQQSDDADDGGRQCQQVITGHGICDGSCWCSGWRPRENNTGSEQLIEVLDAIECEIHPEYHQDERDRQNHAETFAPDSASKNTRNRKERFAKQNCGQPLR